MARFALLLFTFLLAFTTRSSEVSAQVQTFYILPQQEEPAQQCAARFSEALVNFQTFRGTQDPNTQRTVSECLGAIAGSASQRECALSMANIEVDFLLRLRSSRLGDGWNWTVEALSPSQGGDQVWGGSDIAPGLSDKALAAYDSCSYLAMKFACTQETNQGCVDAQQVEEDRQSRRNATTAADPGPAPGPSPTPTPPTPPQPKKGLDPRFSGWILVSGLLPSNATITVDGEIVGTGNGEYAVVAGQKRVVFSAPGYETTQKSVAVSVGAIETLENVTLKKVPSYLQTRAISPSGAAILIDGERVGSGTGRFEITEGDHVVTITARGYEPVDRKIRMVQGGTSIVENITLERAPTRFTVEVSPSTTVTRVDGNVAFNGNGTMLISPGIHRIEFSAPGYATKSEDVVFDQGVETEMLDVSLRLIPATLRVSSDEDDAEVWVNGELLGQVDADASVSFNVDPGTYQLSVGKMGYDPYAQSVTLAAGDNPLVAADLTKRAQNIFGFSLNLGAGSSFLSEPFFDDAKIADANGEDCSNGCVLSWDPDAASSEAKRFEWRYGNETQGAGPGFEFNAEEPSFLVYVETRPDVTILLSGTDSGSYNPATGEYVAGRSFERRIPWSRTTLGMAFMTPRDGFDLDLGIGWGFHWSSFGDLTDEVAGFIGPRAEIFVPVGDMLGLSLQYELTLGSMSVSSADDDFSDGANSSPDPTVTQRLALGVELGF